MWLRRGLAALCGGALALAFPAPGWWWLAWIGLVPFLLLLARSRSGHDAVWLSWLAGSGFFLALHHWLVPSLGMFALPVFALLGVCWVPFGLLARRLLAGGRTGLALVVLPSVWVTVEALRSWKYLGGSWGLLGLTQWQVRPVLALAALGGVWLVSFVLVAVNAGLAVALLPGAPRRARLAGALAAVALAAVATGSGLARPEPRVTGTLRVAGVQTGVIHDRAARLDAHLALTRSLPPGGHDVVVWGQSSVGFDPAQDPGVAARLRAAAAGADLLVNVDARRPDGRISKSSRQFTATGEVASYTKQRLVPFGEYVPLRALFGWVRGVSDAAQTDRVPGTRPVLFEVPGVRAGCRPAGPRCSTRAGVPAGCRPAGPRCSTPGRVRLGPLISYESTFPDMRRTLARMGAQVTVVQGSLTTFHGSWAQPQQASFEAVRAVESGRPAVLVELSGTSAAFDARGRRLLWVPSDQRRAFVVQVPLSVEATPYVRWGDWVPAAAGTVTLLTLLALVRTRWSRR